MIWLVIVTKPIDWLGGGVGARKQSYIEKRRLSFMYFIVDKMIILLSARFMIGWPYIYRCDWFPKWFRLYFCKICITLLAKVALWIAKKGHKNRKWLVSSIPLLQRHISEGVSMKLWHFLWYLKGLRPTLNWSRYRSPNGSCMPKIFFFFGRIKDKMWYLRILIDGIFSKWVITLFQAVIASGKKLLIYLEERHLISWKVLRLLFWLYKGLRLRGSLSLR